MNTPLVLLSAQGGNGGGSMLLRVDVLVLPEVDQSGDGRPVLRRLIRPVHDARQPVQVRVIRNMVQPVPEQPAPKNDKK